MSDNITLPREVAEHLTKMLEECPLIPNADWSERDCDALNALRTHLAAPRLEVTVDPRLTAEEAAAISAAIDARKKEQSEDIEAMRRDAEQGRWLRDWLDNNGLLIRAIRGESLAGYEHPDIEALRRDAERYRWLRNRACHGPHERFVSEYGWFDVSGQHEPGFDAAIDAAMEDKR